MSRKILVVDDTRNVQMMLSDFLEEGLAAFGLSCDLSLIHI